MANIYDLKNVQKPLSGGTLGTDLGLGAVPTGKKRFVVAIKLETITNADLIYIGEASAAVASTVSPEKLRKKLDGTFLYPENPDIKTPLFYIEAGGYLGAVTSGASDDTELTVLYFDE